MKRVSHSYYVVMIHYPRYINGADQIVAAGDEAVVSPSITRREVVSRIRSGEYPKDRIMFIDFIVGDCICDVTDEICAEAAQMQAAE